MDSANIDEKDIENLTLHKNENKKELIQTILMETMEKFEEFFEEFLKMDLESLKQNWKHEKWIEVIDTIFKKIKEKKKDLNISKNEVINSLIYTIFLNFKKNYTKEEKELITNYFSEIWEQIKEKNEINLLKILSAINNSEYNNQLKSYIESYDLLTKFSNKIDFDLSQNIFVNQANIGYSIEKYDMNCLIKDCEENYNKSNIYKQINFEYNLEEELKEFSEEKLEKDLEEKSKIIFQIYANLEWDFKKYDLFLSKNLEKLNNDEIGKFFNSELNKWKKNIETKNKNLAYELSKEVMKEQERVNSILQQKWQNKSKTLNEEQENEITQIYEMYLPDWHLIRNAWSFSSILPFIRSTTTTVQPDSVKYKIILDRISYAKVNKFANSEITNYLKNDIGFIAINRLINFFVEKQHYKNFSDDSREETLNLFDFVFKLYKKYNCNSYPILKFKRKNLNKLFGEEEKSTKTIYRMLPIKLKDSFWSNFWELQPFDYFNQFFSKNFNESAIKKSDKFKNSNFPTKNWFKNTRALTNKEWQTNQFDYRFCARLIRAIFKGKNSSKINKHFDLFSDLEIKEKYQTFLADSLKIKSKQQQEEAKLELEDKTKLVVDSTEKYKNILEIVNTYLYEKKNELTSFKNNKKNDEENAIKKIKEKINSFAKILNEATEKTENYILESKNEEFKKLCDEFNNNFNLYNKKLNLNDEKKISKKMVKEETKENNLATKQLENNEKLNKDFEIREH